MRFFITHNKLGSATCGLIDLDQNVYQLKWISLTCFFIGFTSIFTYENKSNALWHLALFPLAPYEQGAKEQ